MASRWSSPGWAAVYPGFLHWWVQGQGVSVQGTPLLNLKRRSPLLGPGDSVDSVNGYKFVI